MGTRQAPDLREREFQQILEERRLVTLFQPVVHLGSGAIVGHEALVRGPHGSSLASADALLHAAYALDRVVEFDWIARALACRAAIEADLPRDHLLFMNIEPMALRTDCPRDLWPEIERAFSRFQVMLEVTERSLDRDPASLLDGIDRYRQVVTGLALDDVGSNVTTMSMLPLVAPALIKLDLRVTQGGPTAENARVLDAVYEEAERTGALIVCEGIETAEHLAAAQALGATLGQGHYFGKPDVSLDNHHGRATQFMRITAAPTPPVSTPFGALQGRLTGRGGQELLTSLAEQLESYASDTACAALFIVHLPSGRTLDAAGRQRLERLADRGVLTAVLGPDVPAQPGSGIRGADQRSAVDFGEEWAVIALTPGSAGALLARPVDGSHTEFDFGITHDKQRVIAAARCLFRRLGPARSADGVGAAHAPVG